MVRNLLPLATEAPRCAEFAREIGLLPRGTGLFLERVILVSVPLPWPKPALRHDLVESAAPLVTRSGVASRLFASEPISADTRVEVFERHGASAQLTSWTLPDPVAIEPLLGAIVDTPLAGLTSIDIEGAAVDQANAAVPPTFLICTQGSHDLCCGVDGVALADQLENERPDYVVRRVSHTGGHRFAPTLLAFPEGRMWAFVDQPLVDRIATGTETAADHLRHARGWWGAKVGAAQVAECAVRSELADQRFVAPVVQAIDPVEGQLNTLFTVTVNQEQWQVHVVVEREVPTIACESPGGLPAKPGREFSWSIERC